MSSLKDRVAQYEGASQNKLLNKVPLIIAINGRSFAKTTSLLDKPFCKMFAKAMCSCLFQVISEVEGAVFGYFFNDEIVLVLRNDQTIDTAPWYDNDIQKIASSTASMATLYFNNFVNSIDLNLAGDGIFTSKAFIVPNITEAINVIIYKQQLAAQISIQNACFYELINKNSKTNIKEMLSGLNYDEKIELLYQESGIDFSSYPNAFRRGVACYRAPVVVSYNGTDVVKNKWKLDDNLPIFTKDHLFLNQIIKKEQY